ncbi:MAG: 4-hydroxythreonine-4-phosphate dehydrogenase PdxA [Isosphaeraceae bacterium]
MPASGPNSAPGCWQSPRSEGWPGRWSSAIWPSSPRRPIGWGSPPRLAPALGANSSGIQTRPGSPAWSIIRGYRPAASRSAGSARLAAGGGRSPTRVGDRRGPGGTVDAIVTAAIHKEALALAEVPHPGHTEILAERTRAARHCMMLTSPSITCSLVTSHVGLRDVPGLLNARAVLDTIELTTDAMRRIRGREPRLVACGLNPHAGEHGLFGGREEENAIIPAVVAARSRGIEVEGPIPPDTAFLPARRERTDAYICQYHDQGLIPLKMLAFDEAINVTLGLPIVRTSVDHGTAFDIAWSGKASPKSLFEAFRLAARLAEGRPRSPDP